MMQFNELLRFMIERATLELHLVPGSPVMYRDNNFQLNPVDAAVLSPGEIKKLVTEILSPEQKNEFAQKNEITIAYSVPGLSRYRIAAFVQRNSIALLIKTVPPKPPVLDDLNLPPLVKDLSTRVTKGLVVICGPKASGKSSTLAAIINHIVETRSCKVMTLENPIKYLFKNQKGVICQREVGIDVKDYNAAFDALPHSGGDAFVINGVETYEIASRILTMAAGGQLVFVTLAAANVQMVLEKFIDLYPPNLQGQCKTLLAVGLEAIMSQILVKKSAGDGFIPAVEALVATGPVKTLLREGKIYQIQSIMSSAGREIGMQTQEQALRGLVKKNIITQDEAYSNAVRPEEFRKIMALPF
jgi:twitching motility protein PilT